MAVQPIPEGYHTVTPFIIVDGAAALLDFMASAFNGRERMRMPMPDGKIAHAEMEIGDSVVMVSDATDEYPARPVALHLYVENADQVYQKALAAGATSEREPADQFYGDRSGTVIDRWGNRWSIATHIEDVTPEQMRERMASMPGS